MRLDKNKIYVISKKILCGEETRACIKIKESKLHVVEMKFLK
jgi:hypothetical protein